MEPCLVALLPIFESTSERSGWDNENGQFSNQELLAVAMVDWRVSCK